VFEVEEVSWNSDNGGLLVFFCTALLGAAMVCRGYISKVVKGIIT
jgi:hypothetical protein